MRWRIKKVDFVSVDIKIPSSGEKNDLTVLQKILDNMKDGQLKAVISDKKRLCLCEKISE